MKKYFDSVIGANGVPPANASITIYNYGTLVNASIYNDAAGTVPLINPIVADTNGYFEFYAADGRYSLSIAATGYSTRSITDVLLDDPANASAVVISGGTINATPIGATTPSTGAFTALSASGVISANGGAIAFPATQVPSSDPNTIDDYKEGTFTPTVVGGGTAGSATYTGQAGEYTKTGNRVNFTLSVSYSAHTGTGAIRVGGLPFNTNSGASFLPVANVAANGVTFSGQLVAISAASISYYTLYSNTSGASLATANVTNTSTTIYMSGSYAV